MPRSGHQRLRTLYRTFAALQLRLERLDGVNAELRGDAADSARDEPGRSRDVALVGDMVPVLGKEAFLGKVPEMVSVAYKARPPATPTEYS